MLLQELFKLKHYNDLDGGILEGFGRLLKFDLKIYVYPTLDTKTGEVITAENVKVSRPPWHQIFRVLAADIMCSEHVPACICNISDCC